MHPHGPGPPAHGKEPWAPLGFTTSTRRVKFVPGISGCVGFCGVLGSESLRLGLVKLRGVQQVSNRTFPYPSLAGQGGLFLLGSRSGAQSWAWHISAQLSCSCTRGDRSWQCLEPSLDWAAHWMLYVELCWRQTLAVPAPAASQDLHMGGKG